MMIYRITLMFTKKRINWNLCITRKKMEKAKQIKQQQQQKQASIKHATKVK
jgi:hypothetical protein